MTAVSSVETSGEKSKWPVLLANGLLFQCAWFANVLAPALAALAVTVAVVAVHLVLVRKLFGASAFTREVFWLALVLMIGWLVETGAFVAQLLVYEAAPAWQLGWVPGWLLCLWLAFATTFRFSLAFLTQRPVYAAPVGFLALLSYYSGAALSADVALGGSWIWSLVAIGLIWAVVLTVLSLVYGRCWVSFNSAKSPWEGV